MTRLTEDTHVSLDENIDQIVDSVIRSLQYKLCKMAVNGEVKLSTDPVRVYASELLSCGRDWAGFSKIMSDEIAKEKEKRMFQYPIKLSFCLTNEEIPSGSFIASDCEFVFVIDSICKDSVSGIDTDDAYIEKNEDVFVTHFVRFFFNISFEDIKNLPSIIRHELMHVFDEVVRYKAKIKDIGDYDLNDDVWKRFGFFKTNKDKERDFCYKFMTNLIQSTESDIIRNPEYKSMTIEINCIARILYLLYPSEIKANYSEFYRDIVENNHKHYYESRAYKKYHDMLVIVLNGIKISNNNKTDILDIGKDEYVFQKIRPYAVKILKTSKDFTNASEFKHYLMKKIDFVLDRMKKIYKFVRERQQSAEEEFKCAYEAYYEKKLSMLQERFGEEDGMYRFTMSRNLTLEPFQEVILKIEKYFK